MTTLKSAAEKYGANIGYLDSSIMYENAFLAGASFERARILELMHSKEADEYDFTHPREWGYWISRKLKELDGAMKPGVYRMHICQSISGALANWDNKTWDAIGKDNNLTGDQMKERFRIMEFEGKRVLPIGEPCEGFSYETGCPGHERT